MTSTKENTINEEKLLSEGYRKYTGSGINVYFNRDKCQHAGNCVRGSHEVFNVNRKP